MIKNIQQIKDKPISFIKEFINNCTIEEKIDTHYIIIEITSKQTITLRKSNNKIINRIDMILNDMWGQVITDWNYIKLINSELFASCVGYKIACFYFPTSKPILTEYKENIKYVIDHITFNEQNINVEYFINNLTLKDKFHIYKKHNLTKTLNTDIFKNINGENKKTLDYNKIFLDLINKDDENIFAKNQPEGYIYKWNNNLYQLTFNKRSTIIPEKTQYEYLLCDFMNFCKNNGYQDKITQYYIKTVCSLFNDYIINWEEKYNNIKNNIDINSIEPPTFGTVYDIGYEYIPDIITLNLCKSNILYKNIFKVLLANLKKGKDYNKCIYMNKKQVEYWNIIMKNIKIHSIYI